MAARGESVVIHNFWPRRIVFHRRSDPGTGCDPDDRQNIRGYPCGHALPRLVAEQIAHPCKKCYPAKPPKEN